MKTVLKFRFGLAALLLAGLAASSCAREDVEVEPVDLSEIIEESLPPKQSAIYKHIADHKKERTRAGEMVKLEPVIYEGDTVMYIANYGDGWEVFSNSTTMPMVLMRSETGRLDAASMRENPAFAYFFKMSKENLAAEMHDAGAEAQPGSEEWVDFGVQSINGGPRRKPAPDPLVLIGSSPLIIQRDSPIGHLLTTAWHQNSPYNQFVPKKKDEVSHYPTGCSPIAVAQYLYFWHFKYGVPVNSVTSASYDSSNNLYVFSGSSSTIWNSMPLGTESPLPTYKEAEPAALLVGNLARIMQTKFEVDSAGKASGSTIRANYIACINAQTGQNLSAKKFSAESIYNLIKASKPVVTSLGGDEGGHTAVTDYTRREFGYRDFYYVPARLVDTTEPWEEGMGPRPGNYGSGDMTIERRLVSTSYYFKMNWGNGSWSSDPEVNGALLEVTYDGTRFTSIIGIY